MIYERGWCNKIENYKLILVNNTFVCVCVNIQSWQRVLNKKKTVVSRCRICGCYVSELLGKDFAINFAIICNQW